MSIAIEERIRRFLSEPGLRALDPDSADFTRVHREVVRSKILVRELFTEFCRRCWVADQTYFGSCARDLRLEIGTGAGMMKEAFPSVITSDVKLLPWVDLIARAEDLPFPDESLRAVYGINVFHHSTDPRVFMREMSRVTAPGGGFVLIEPYYGPLARLLFKRLFTMEHYDLQVREWPHHERTQVASGANQGLSYIVLRRDIIEWQREFPELELVADEPHTYLSYLISGGVNFRQLLPTSIGRLLFRVEDWFPALNPFLALEHTVVVRKRKLNSR